MKSTFADNERRIQEFKGKHSGRGAADKYKPRWPLYSYMLFLKKTVEQSETTSNILNSSQSSCAQPSTLPQLATNNPSTMPQMPSLYYDEHLMVRKYL